MDVLLELLIKLLSLTVIMIFLIGLLFVMLISVCIFRKNCASVPEERSAIPLQTEQSSAGLLVAIIYSTIPARKFKTICLGCHSA